MIKKIGAFIKKCFRSLRIGMLFAIVVAIISGVTAGLLVHKLFMNWIDNEYNSQESKQQRYENYIADLQSFVDKYEVSSEDTAQITRWVRNNRNIYLFLYKDNQLFFDSSIQVPDTDENKNNSSDTKKEDTEGNEGEENTGEENTGEENTGEENAGSEENNTASDDNIDTDTPAEDSSDSETTEDSAEDSENKDTVEDTDVIPSEPDADNSDTNTDVKTDSETSNSSSGNNNSSDSQNDKNSGADNLGGGLTVEYPTREEIIAAAKNNGLLPLDLSDGTLFVSLADFTEYIYYDVANIVSVVVGVLILTIILMLYFQNILAKISRLAKDVTNVYEVDMNTPIRTDNGNNELSALTRNVEEMRSSMLESLANEKEAINANTELITSMSHDIRTPLTVLLGYIDIMKNHTDDDTMQDYIKASEVTALRLKELSDDMFRYFLVFGGKNIDADIADYDAKTLFDQLFAEHILLLQEKGYNVSVDNSLVADVSVSTDAPKAMRIVDNLFSNIYKYAEKNKPIIVRHDIVEQRLTVSISNYVFENASKVESNGVGLKTCKKLAEAINMDFEYKTDTANEEKIFTVRMGFALKSESCEEA